MKTHELKLTSALVVHGNIIRAGGIVEVDDATAKDFLRRGKAVLVRDATADDDDKDEGQTDLHRLNKADLQKVADQLGVEYDADATKAQIIEAIEAHQGE